MWCYEKLLYPPGVFSTHTRLGPCSSVFTPSNIMRRNFPLLFISFKYLYLPNHMLLYFPNVKIITRYLYFSFYFKFRTFFLPKTYFNFFFFFSKISVMFFSLKNSNFQSYKYSLYFSSSSIILSHFSFLSS